MGKMTREDLQEMIAQAVSQEVEKNVAPLKDRQESWAKELRASTHSGDGQVQKGKEGIPFARIVRAMAATGGDVEKAARFSEKAWNDDLGKSIHGFFQEKALAAGEFGPGGFMIPEDFVADIIDLLRPRSVMRAAGVPTVPMPHGTLTMPRQTGDITAHYIGENRDITASQPEGGQLVMTARKLAAVVPISNDLLTYQVGNMADQYVRRTMVQHLGTREDRAFLRDQGTEFTPRGLRYWVPSAHEIPTTTADGSQTYEVEENFRDLIEALEGSDVSMSNPAFIMSSRTKNFLMHLRHSGGGNLIYPELRDRTNPTLYGYSVFVSNNVPNNLGSGGDESEIYFFNVDDALIGEVGGLEITVDSSASYFNGSELDSAFSQDQTVIRAIMKHDFAMMYDQAVAVMTGVKWQSVTEGN